jgi:hypothetical protein
VYSQAGFGTDTIDIRFGAAQEIHDSALLSIDTDAEFDALASYVFSPSPTVSMFFVDAINFCGVAAPNVVGCGSTPGSLIALDSSFMLQPEGANTIAHELGHNLGLDHTFPDNGTNLMNPTVFATFGFLNNAQITSILTSGLIQTDLLGNKYIEVTPIAVLASVPEPSTWALLGAGAGVALMAARRQRKQDAA